MKKRGLIAAVLVLLVAAIAVTTSRHKSSIKVPAMDGGKADVKVEGAPAATSPMQLELLAGSDSVDRGQAIAFTVTFKNAGTSEITVMDPCGHPFNLKVEAGGHEIDDWLQQTYGGIPSCPAGSGIRVPPGERHRATLRLRFPTPGTFTVYATNLGSVSGIDGNLRSNQVTVHAH